MQRTSNSQNNFKKEQSWATNITWSIGITTHRETDRNESPEIRLHVSRSVLCLTLWDPMDCSPPSSSVHGILQARTLQWAAIPFSKGSSWPRGWTRASCTAGRFFTIWAIREAQNPEIEFHINTFKRKVKNQERKESHDAGTTGYLDAKNANFKPFLTTMWNRPQTEL